MNNDIMCMSLAADMSDDEIKECVQDMMLVCNMKGRGFCLSIAGYDNDPRELWQIPEAVHFMQRLYKFGVISGLEISTTIEKFLPEEFKELKLPGFGAIEIWLCATNRMRSGDNEITADTWTAFKADLMASNAVAAAICQEPPYRTGMKKKEYPAQVPDGAVKYHGFKKGDHPKWFKK